MKTSTKTQPAGRLNLLTARQVQAAGEGDHSDGGGLYLRVRGTSASWLYRYTATTGARREMGLGPLQRNNPKAAGESLTAARDAASEARKVRMAGRDPIEARAQSKAAEAGAIASAKAVQKRERMTLARVARDYHAKFIEPKRSPKHAAQWVASLENHVPAGLWHAPIAAIEAPELLEGLLGIKPHSRARNLPAGAKPEAVTIHETISRIRQRLEVIFEHAQFLKLCTYNPAQAIKRKLGEGLPDRPEVHLRALPYKEVPAFVRRLREAPGQAARALELCILTASRTSEVLGARWCEIDLEGGLWTIPKERMKAGKEHRVFLPPRAVEIIQAQAGLHAELLFPSLTVSCEGKPLSTMSMLVLLKRMNADKATTVHGFRSCFSVWAYETNAARQDVIEAALAHSEKNKVKAAYARTQFDDERRDLLLVWEQFVYQTAEVVDINSRRAA